jgi:hypothetical protein
MNIITLCFTVNYSLFFNKIYVRGQNNTPFGFLSVPRKASVGNTRKPSGKKGKKSVLSKIMSCLCGESSVFLWEERNNKKGFLLKEKENENVLLSSSSEVISTSLLCLLVWGFV